MDPRFSSGKNAHPRFYARRFFPIAIFAVFFFGSGFFFVRAATNDPVLTWARLHGVSGSWFYATSLSMVSTGTITYDWDRAFNSLNNDDYTRGMTMDSSGNVYLIGFAYASRAKYRIVKYDLLGNVVSGWEDVTAQQVSGLSFDYGRDGAVDSSGNLYVIGFTTTDGGSSPNYDVMTVKFSPSGARMNFGPNPGDTYALFSPGQDNRAGDVEVDAQNNVYVVGRSRSPKGDIEAVKYTSSGSTVWNGASLGGSNHVYHANTLAINRASGEVYAGGYDAPSSGADDAVLVKYSSTTGSIVTSRTYDMSGISQDDRLVSIATDPSGNIYALGMIYNGSTFDYKILKYTSALADAPGWTPITIPTNFALAEIEQPPSDGDVEWRGAEGSIFLDAQGRIYITGIFKNGSNKDVRVYAYTSTTGSQLYAKTFRTNSYDEGKDVLVDGGGNVYVGGSSDVLFNPGSMLLTKYKPLGSLYVLGDATGFPAGGAFALKYDTNGNFLWEKYFESFGAPTPSVDLPTSIAADPFGNFYLGGETNADAAIAKFDPSGNEITSGWPKYLPDTGNYETVRDLATDSSGNVYVAVDSWNAGNISFDATTIKYDPAGNQLWSRTFDGSAQYPSSKDDVPRTIAVDSSGNVYASFAVGQSGSNMFWRTIKYDSAGSRVLGNWDNLVYDPVVGASGEDPVDIVTDPQGNVLITGRGKSGSFSSAKTIKYNSAGTLLWSTTYDVASYNDTPGGIAVDGEGNAYITLYTQTSSVSSEYFYAMKYASSTGAELFGRPFDGGYDEGGADIAVDGEGSVYIAGSPNLGSTLTQNPNLMLVKYLRYAGAGLACNVPLSIARNATTSIWFDDTIVPNITLPKKRQISELRAWINNQRADVRLPSSAWTDEAITPKVTRVRAQHFTEMRTAINAVYAACSQTAPTFTDPTLNPGTVIRKPHIDELRSATLNAP